MKKVILMLCMALAFSQNTSAQINFGVKGGLNYNSNSIKEVGTDVFEGAKSKTGYHAGIWLRAKVPVLGLYIRPEFVYTNLENEVLYKTTGAKTTYSFQKIDVPVLIGKKIFGIGNVFIGPSFQYILDAGFDFDAIPKVDTDDITVGLQFGAGIEIGKIGLDVIVERGFSGIESKIVGNAGISNFDTRVNQVIIGLSYKL